MTAISPGWRPTPPTVDEVRQCQWWWVRDLGLDIEPHVMTMEVDPLLHLNEISVLDGPRFVAFDHRIYGTEWAPCLPPDDPTKLQMEYTCTDCRRKRGDR